MHFPAGILLANGYFCLHSLNKPSFNEYKKLLVFREFLSAEDDATPQQKELLCEMFKGTTEAQQEMLRNPEQMREQYLTDYARYFSNIVASHQKRVQKLIEEDKIEAALTLAMQADYFSQFTTIQGVRNQLKQPLDFTIFHSDKYQEKIGQEKLSNLLPFNLEKIIDSDLVKPEDKQDFQRILYHLDMRKIKEFFQITDLSINPTFPPEILGTDGKLDLSKFLQAEKTQDSLKPYFDHLDKKKSSFIAESSNFITDSNLLSVNLLTLSMGCVALAILVPPAAPFTVPMAIVVGVVVIGLYAGTRLYNSAKLQQIENLRTNGKKITLPTACQQVISREVATLYKTTTCSAARTLSCITRRTLPNTAISRATAITPQTLGREEDGKDGVLISL